MNERQFLSRVRLRLLLVGLLAVLWILAIGARLLYLQVVARDSLRARAELQQQHTLGVDSTRGTIYDRHGRELAISAEVQSVYAVPTRFNERKAIAAAKKLSRCFDLREKTIMDRLLSDRSFVWLRRKARLGEVECVRKLDLDGVDFLPESRRFYPKRQVAAHILGYVGMDNEGMSGVEYALEEQIRGTPGRRMIWTDARKRVMASRVDRPSKPGQAVYLTIDENLQLIIEDELNRALDDSGALGGIAIIMKPETGEIRAMASAPAFNPNRYGDFPASFWRNRAVTDAYEPGSTFKIITAAAALEEQVTSEDERIDCGLGAIPVGNRLIRDHQSFDVLTFREVLEKSSNVGMIRVGQRLGKKRLERYIRAFGFGETTGIELRGESRGILRPSSSWGPVTLASISFGQEIAVTPLQMIVAANVIASSGYLMRPRLLLAFAENDGLVQRELVPARVRRVFSAQTADRLTKILTGVVERGTGRRAAVEGFLVAGKTGTAQKAVAGGYSKTDYVASFVGFVPAERPELTGLVILDSPHGDHSGARAAAVFSRIMERALRYLGVTGELGSTIQIRRDWPTLPRPRRATGLDISDGLTRVPNVVGLGARDAVREILARGLTPELVGTGWIFKQRPAPGTLVAPGETCRLILGPSGSSREQFLSAELDDVMTIVRPENKVPVLTLGDAMEGLDLELQQ